MSTFSMRCRPPRAGRDYPTLRWSWIMCTKDAAPASPSFGAFAMCYDLELSMTNADSAAEWFDALDS